MVHVWGFPGELLGYSHPVSIGVCFQRGASIQQRSKQCRGAGWVPEEAGLCHEWLCGAIQYPQLQELHFPVALLFLSDRTLVHAQLVVCSLCSGLSMSS